jgi:hypothetical protein
MPRPREKRSARTHPSEGPAPIQRPSGARRGPGRPPIHDEQWTKVTVVLFDRQIAFLDQVAASIRAKTGAAISRAQLIRALVDAVGEANIDLTAARSEAEMKVALLGHFGVSANAVTAPAAGRRRPSQDG